MTTPKTPSPSGLPPRSPVPAPAPSSSLPANRDYISRAKTTIYNTLETRRPWRHLFTYQRLSRPRTPYVIFTRLKTNLSYFRLNFTLLILLTIFLSLLYEPVSLIVFLVMMVAWLFLFFLRDQPLVLLGRVVDERVVFGVLSLLTIVFLLFAGATVNVVVSLMVGVSVVVVYSAFRETDDLFVDEEQAVGAGILAGSTGFGPDPA